MRSGCAACVTATPTETPSQTPVPTDTPTLSPTATLSASATATPAYMATVSAADASAFGMGYFPSSTGYKVTYNTADDPESGIKNIQYYAGMITYNKSYNRMTIAYQGGYGAAPVRCIKNKE